MDLTDKKIITGIYKITSPTGRIYIGQSINIEKRFKEYKKIRCKSQVKLFKSLNKYGPEKHLFEIEKVCDRNELSHYERLYQELYNCLDEGLNCMFVNNANAPAVRSQATKDKISAFNKGKKWGKEFGQAISKGRTGIEFTDKHKENIKLSKTGENNVRSIKVINLFTGIFYDSIAEASAAHNIDHRTLSRYLNGTRSNKTNLMYA